MSYIPEMLTEEELKFFLVNRMELSFHSVYLEKFIDSEDGATKYVLTVHPFRREAPRYRFFEIINPWMKRQLRFGSDFYKSVIANLISRVSQAIRSPLP